MPAKGSRVPLEQRFWEKVDQTGECWLWQANKNKQGYGAIQVEGRSHPAHRIAYEMTHGAIPNGMVVCHRCDNPSCVRPDHLFVGTYKDNSQDMSKKGRGALGPRNGAYTHPERRPSNHGPRPSMQGARNPQAKLTPEVAALIRTRHQSGASTRALAKEFSLSRWAIHTVVTGKRWTHS